MDEYIRRKVYIDDGKHNKFRELKGSDVHGDSVFSSMKDIFMVAAIMGYNSGEKREVKNGRDIFDKGVFNEHDLTLLYSIFLDYYQDVEALESTDVLGLIEEFANAGIDELYELVNKQGEGIVNVVEEILVNYS
ncbi:hypothetical protein MWH28_07245 [Natroniella sulfidigena]|uniref:hypothetical protein n=1 Tax=Natroniella sulfidigena TaxID=723921 RepID=UPI00200A585A|nr:hypothetical protein [Natroniella sulfidigena]MCK8817154.1 hypothetical protein [Natroniella sulfidigena]